MNILDTLSLKLDGKSWESLCIDCYRERYKNEHYTPIPASNGGDGGIEGFTQTGVANQCYCPEKHYSDNECFEHMRDKMTNDINKLLDLKNQKKLFEHDVPPIREWHFVIPQYSDSRILKHAHKKKMEVLKAREESPSSYPCIHSDFKILIKCADDFKSEIGKMFLIPYNDHLIDLDISNVSYDYSKCDSKKLENIKRKIKAISNDDDSVEDLINIFVQSYIRGMGVLNKLKDSYPQVCEALMCLEQDCKKNASIMTKLNPNSSNNYTLFKSVLDDFGKELLKKFEKSMSSSLINEIKHDLIASWLADCSMEFRK